MAWVSGVPAVCGVPDLRIDPEGARAELPGGIVIHEGDVVTIDGSAGSIMRGAARLVPPQPDVHLARLLKDATGARTERHLADWYFRLLRPHAPHVDVWRTTYFHPLAGARAIVEWLKGTGLRPFLDPLEESERKAFLARYEEAIAKAYPAEADGTVLLPFPRLFVVATR